MMNRQCCTNLLNSDATVAWVLQNASEWTLPAIIQGCQTISRVTLYHTNSSCMNLLIAHNMQMHAGETSSPTSPSFLLIWKLKCTLPSATCMILEYSWPWRTAFNVVPLRCQHSAVVNLQSKSHILLPKVKASSKAILTDIDLWIGLKKQSADVLLTASRGGFMSRNPPNCSW